MFREQSSWKKHNKNKQLFIIIQDNFWPATKTTMHRWMRYVFKLAGFDEVFSAHSTRAATTLKAFIMGIKLDQIMNMAAWTTDNVFHKHYKRCCMSLSSYTRAKELHIRSFLRHNVSANFTLNRTHRGGGQKYTIDQNIPEVSLITRSQRLISRWCSSLIHLKGNTKKLK